MRESLVISQKVRTFAPVLKMVVIHSVRANGNRSLGKNAKVSLFYGQSDAHRCMPSAPVITAAIQKDFGALRGTAIFRTTGCAAVPLSNRLVKKATMQQEEIWKDKTCHTGVSPPCVTRPRIIHQLNIPRVGLRCGSAWCPGILFSPASVAAL